MIDLKEVENFELSTDLDVDNDFEACTKFGVDIYPEK